MAEEQNPPEKEGLQNEFDELTEEMQEIIDGGGLVFLDDMILLNAIYYLWAQWIDFHIYIVDPYISKKLPAEIIPPGTDQKTQAVEHVYSIYDYGDRLSASAGEDIVDGSRCTGRMLNTVRKMIDIMLERIKTALGTTDLDPDFEIRIGFDGHEISQRMAFKDCIMRAENIAITNFEPGEWGELQLRTMETLADKGFLPGL